MKYLKHDEKKFAPCGCIMKQTTFKKSSTAVEQKKFETQKTW